MRDLGLSGVARRAVVTLAAAASMTACGGEIAPDGAAGGGGGGASGGGPGAGGAAAGGAGGAAGTGSDCAGLARPPSGPVEPADCGELTLVAHAVRMGDGTPEAAVGFDLDCAAGETCQSGPVLEAPRGVDAFFDWWVDLFALSRDGEREVAIAARTWSVAVRARAPPDGSAEVWIMNVERDDGAPPGASGAVWRPWPEHQGATGAAPSRATLRAGHLVSEPTGVLAVTVRPAVLSGRPVVERLFIDLAPSDAAGVRRAIVAGRMSEAEQRKARRELEPCCRFNCSDGWPLGDLRHADENLHLCEDMSFGMELDLVPAVLGETTETREGMSVCAW
ncbi:MAG: hypothetical protein IT376_07160 [Polyangiaceae bacterium]|nr:hypothetical protein [Polyangiaceae bacterium]